MKKSAYRRTFCLPFFDQKETTNLDKCVSADF
jgi:hypothetical protein